MKMNRTKALLMVAMIAVLLTAAIGGTFAWLETSTAPVKNVFMPSKVTGDIVEHVDGDVKDSVQIKNTGDIPVYVRVAIVGNWVKDGQIVESQDITFTLGTDWVKGTDGYYYYTKPVPVGELTSDLLGSEIKSTTREDGAHLEVTVIQQCIQTEPAQALTDANWGWKPSGD